MVLLGTTWTSNEHLVVSLGTIWTSSGWILSSYFRLEHCCCWQIISGAQFIVLSRNYFRKVCARLNNYHPERYHGHAFHCWQANTLHRLSSELCCTICLQSLGYVLKNDIYRDNIMLFWAQFISFCVLATSCFMKTFSIARGSQIHAAW